MTSETNDGAKGAAEQAGNNDQDYNLRTAEWSLPADLMQMLQQQGEPNAEFFLNFIKAALHNNVDEDTIIKACLDHEPPYGGSIYKHVQAAGGEAADREDYIKRTIERVINAPLLGKPGREKIIVPRIGTATDEIWRQVEQVLIKKKLPVFVRNKCLVQPIWRWHKVTEGRKVHNVLSAELEPYNLVQLTDMVAHNAVQFTIYKKGKAINIDPPSRIIKPVLGIRHYKLPDICGFITSPTMRPDGSLLTEPGYDEQTQLFYKPSDNVLLPPISDKPTRDDAVKALALLNGLFDEFPFEGAVDAEGKIDKDKQTVSRSAALAGLMTTVARGALNAAVPLFVVTAPKGRTGKTYLVELIGTIATGHIPVCEVGSEDNIEFEKRVETAALVGRLIIHFNNMPEGMVVKSVGLAQLSTEGKVHIRKLGLLEEGTADCRATTVWINGNNILLSGDLVPRAAHCRLNANMEHPEDREFAEKPIERVRANRGVYLAAVFTIIKAFRAAGEPKPAAYKHVAGFEQWSAVVQQALIWLGMADPLGAMETMRAMDPKQEDLQRLVNTLRACLSTTKERNAFTVAMCEKKANEDTGERIGEWGQRKYKYPALRDLMSLKGQISTRHFGRTLTNARDQWCNGWCIKVHDGEGAYHTYYLAGTKEAVEADAPAVAAADKAAETAEAARATAKAGARPTAPAAVITDEPPM